MLLQMKRMRIDFVEVPIATVYEGDNEGSHFRPIVDSLKIMKLIFVFMLTSLSSTLIDIGIFYLMLKLLGEGAHTIMTATIVARLISSFYNFNMNRKVVFGAEGDYKKTFVRYYILCIIQTLVSGGLVSAIKRMIPGGDLVSTLVKFAVDSVLFFISFTIQREWVFREK